jgi:hypothetical protein
LARQEYDAILRVRQPQRPGILAYHYRGAYLANGLGLGSLRNSRYPSALAELALGQMAISAIPAAPAAPPLPLYFCLVEPCGGFPQFPLPVLRHRRRDFQQSARRLHLLEIAARRGAYASRRDVPIPRQAARSSRPANRRCERTGCRSSSCEYRQIYATTLRRPVKSQVASCAE